MQTPSNHCQVGNDLHHPLLIPPFCPPNSHHCPQMVLMLTCENHRECEMNPVMKKTLSCGSKSSNKDEILTVWKGRKWGIRVEISLGKAEKAFQLQGYEQGICWALSLRHQRREQWGHSRSFSKATTHVLLLGKCFNSRSLIMAHPCLKPFSRFLFLQDAVKTNR